MSVGLSKSKSKSGTSFGVTSTGFSDLGNKKLTLDPTIRNLRNQSLDTISGGVGTFGQSISGLRQRLLDNATGLEAARVNPVLRAAAEREGQIRSNLGRRGLGGSSFMQSALDRSAQEFGVRESDARALAQQELVQALLGLDQAGLGATGMLGTAQNQAAQQILDQEMNALNFGKGQQSSSSSRSFNFGLGSFGGGANSKGGIR